MESSGASHGSWYEFFNIDTYPLDTCETDLLAVVFFKNKVLCALFLQSFLLGAVYQSYLYYLPLYYQNARGWSPIVSAALTSPMVAMQSIASILSGQYISRLQRYGEVIWAGFGLWTL